MNSLSKIKLIAVICATAFLALSGVAISGPPSDGPVTGNVEVTFAPDGTVRISGEVLGGQFDTTGTTDWATPQADNAEKNGETPPPAPKDSHTGEDHIGPRWIQGRDSALPPLQGYNVFTINAYTKNRHVKNDFDAWCVMVASMLGGGGGCFLPDTRVAMADGSLKAISQVKEGQFVRSYNVSKGLVETREVLKTYVFESDEYYLINGSLKATAQHPFLMLGPGEVWKKASELSVGDRVRSVDGEIAIKSIQKVRMAEKFNTYNFRVADSKNYLVVDENGPYVVHNGL